MQIKFCYYMPTSVERGYREVGLLIGLSICLDMIKILWRKILTSCFTDCYQICIWLEGYCQKAVSAYAVRRHLRPFGRNPWTYVQSTLNISNSDISNSAKLEASIWIKNTFWLLSPTIIWRWRLFSSPGTKCKCELLGWSCVRRPSSTIY